MNAKENNDKKTLSLGLALIPIISMLTLLIVGYGVMGLRIEPPAFMLRRHCRRFSLLAGVLLG